MTTIGNTTYFHIRHENLFVVAVTRSNANAALVFEFLQNWIDICNKYFGKFDEEAVKSNFVLIYELLDEIIDFGYPQNSEFDSLKMYITSAGTPVIKKQSSMSQKITAQATGAIPWRRQGIKHRRNEAFMDIIENVNLIMSASGTVLRSDVDGIVKMRASLSGMPECVFGLNDQVTLGNHEPPTEMDDDVPGNVGPGTGSVVLEDCQFHQCVQLSRFEEEKLISFTPPDGEFELMRYRTTDNVQSPFTVYPIINEIGNSRVEYKIGLKANFASKLTASVQVRVPVPRNASHVNILRTAVGKARYEPSENIISWRINRCPGMNDYFINAEADLTPDTSETGWSKPPISLDFKILMFTASGLNVRYLRVFEKSNYSTVKWVRYTTQAGSFEIRY